MYLVHASSNCFYCKSVMLPFPYFFYLKKYLKNKRNPPPHFEYNNTEQPDESKSHLTYRILAIQQPGLGKEKVWGRMSKLPKPNICALVWRSDLMFSQYINSVNLKKPQL